MYTKDSDSLIYWESGHKLTWKDFKGKAENIDTIGAISATSLKLTITTYKDSLILEVKSYFNTNYSWTRLTDSVSLSHEQGHFDIAEIFARELKHIASTSGALTADSIKKLSYKLYNDLNDF